MRTLFFLVSRAVLLCFGLTVAGAAQASATPVWQSPLVPLVVTRPFAPPPTPYAAGHRGVDLAGHPGQAVLAAADGDIEFAGKVAGRGVVVIVHGALRTTYEPVRASVSRGGAVTAGEQIGTLAAGHAGCPVTACLHWGLLRGKTYLDPLPLIRAPEIRLLTPTAASAAAARVTHADVIVGAGANSPLARSVGLGPTVATWSLAAVAGVGVLVTHRRR